MNPQLERLEDYFPSKKRVEYLQRPQGSFITLSTDGVILLTSNWSPEPRTLRYLRRTYSTIYTYKALGKDLFQPIFFHDANRPEFEWPAEERKVQEQFNRASVKIQMGCNHFGASHEGEGALVLRDLQALGLPILAYPGARHRCPCPFQAHTPDSIPFSFSTVTGLWYCFACDLGGTWSDLSIRLFHLRREEKKLDIQPAS